MALAAIPWMFSREAHAANAVLEGIRTAKDTVFIDTTNARVDIATTSYGGGISNVALYVSSNVVISSSAGNNVVIYATGTIMLNGSVIPSTAPAVSPSAATTFTGAITFNSSVTFNGGAFGLGLSSYTQADLSAFSMSGTNTSLTACISGSTVSLTGALFDVCFDGNMADATAVAGSTVTWGFLIDGGYYSGYSGTKGVVIASDSALFTTGHNMSGCARYIAASSASHTFCLNASSSGGSAQPSCYSGSKCIFSVSYSR